MLENFTVFHVLNSRLPIPQFNGSCCKIILWPQYIQEKHSVIEYMSCIVHCTAGDKKNETSYFFYNFFSNKDIDLIFVGLSFCMSSLHVLKISRMCCTNSKCTRLKTFSVVFTLLTENWVWHMGTKNLSKEVKTAAIEMKF